MSVDANKFRYCMHTYMRCFARLALYSVLRALYPNASGWRLPRAPHSLEPGGSSRPHLCDQVALERTSHHITPSKPQNRHHQRPRNHLHMPSRSVLPAPLSLAVLSLHKLTLPHRAPKGKETLIRSRSRGESCSWITQRDRVTKLSHCVEH